jgi:hypothetical protein
MKFKVGQKVRVVYVVDDGNYRPGDIVTIKARDKTLPYPYDVLLPDGHTWWMPEDSLKELWKEKDLLYSPVRRQICLKSIG